MYPPTLERNGDFSQSYGNNGAGVQQQLKILDPANANVQFANNMIPQSRINPLGQQLLNFFPAAELHSYHLHAVVCQ